MTTTENTTTQGNRSFDTQADALTFKSFLLNTGYTGLQMMFIPVFNLWRVYFDIK